MLRMGLVAATAMLLAGCATANGGCAARTDAAAPAISATTLQEVVRTLASDEFEGREPGTPGEEKSVRYIAQRFEAAGLQPGNNGSWYQEVPLAEITAGNHAPLAIGDMLFTHATDWVGVTYREQERVDLTDSELVFVGYGINAPERNWNDYAGIDMRGKTAVILVNDPDYQNDGLDGPFGGRAMTFYGRWTYKFEEAARQGAAGALIVHDAFPAAYGWNVVESSWTGPQAHAARADRGASQTLMNGWVQKNVAERIIAAAGRDLATLTAAAQRPGFKPVPLGLTVSTGFDNTIRRFASKNVVGLLPGAERPEEYVLYSGHWDHLGRCTPAPDGDDICNGAIDNATGIAALVALAEANRAAGPAARSQVFLAVTAEESGLLGSEYYGANPVFPLAQTVGGVNMDAIAMAGPARDVTVIGGGKSELDAVLEQALAASGRTITPDPSPQAGYYYRSDHFSLAKRGVPMFYIDSGQDLVEGGTAAGAAYDAAYRDNAYHGPKDEYDPDWNWDGIVSDVGLFYRLGRMLADGDSWPNWYPDDEFRRIRDESCAASAKGC
ncbi:M28 family metallopeptidase [Croceibacterium ferulae]|uniref:M28 family metallopeptidase n=1 Tax=Croceibacterium ferulae TaxID=1854641 RepID=UPI000EB36C06|nr:M28 family metallopeptidase [Croceibacterium ferulae]